MGVEKPLVLRERKNIIFRKPPGGGINIVFRPKYRPLPLALAMILPQGACKVITT
jgi:hypothetical protein